MRAILTLAFTLTIINAAAADRLAKIGPLSITLTTPTNACESVETDPNDKRFLAAIRALIEGPNALLAAFVDCNEQKLWRASKIGFQTKFWQYQYEKAYEQNGVQQSDVLNKQCAALRAHGDAQNEKVEADSKVRMSEVINNVVLQGQGFLGVLDETPVACFAGLLQKFKGENGKDIQRIALWASVIIKGRIIHYYQFSPYTNAASILEALAQFKPMVAVFLAVNR